MLPLLLSAAALAGSTLEFGVDRRDAPQALWPALRSSEHCAQRTAAAEEREVEWTLRVVVLPDGRMEATSQGVPPSLRQVQRCVEAQVEEAPPKGEDGVLVLTLPVRLGAGEPARTRLSASAEEQTADLSALATEYVVLERWEHLSPCLDEPPVFEDGALRIWMLFDTEHVIEVAPRGLPAAYEPLYDCLADQLIATPLPEDLRRRNLYQSRLAPLGDSHECGPSLPLAWNPLRSGEMGGLPTPITSASPPPRP